MRWTIGAAAIVALAVGCYRSHRLDDEPADGGVRDSSAPDLAIPRSCAVAVLDRDAREWPSFGSCGPVSASQTVARGTAFDQIARESPETCGRAPQLAARRVRVEGGRLAFDDGEQVIGAAHPAARGLAAAARDGQLIVASGVDWTAYSDSWGADDAGALGMVPESVPGCVFRLDAKDLVPLRRRWLVPFDYFECDVSGAQLGYYDDELAPLREPVTRFPGVGAAVPLLDGALLVTRARPGVDTLLSFMEDPTSEAWTRSLPVGGVAVAAGRWPGGDEVAIAFVGAGPTIHLRILDAEAAVLHRAEVTLRDPELELYLPVSVELATTDFGLVVVVGFEWGGGRIDAATAILAFGRRAEPLMEPAIAPHLGGASPAVSIAGAGDHAVVTAFSSTLEEATARTTLVGCSP